MFYGKCNSKCAFDKNGLTLILYRIHLHFFLYFRKGYPAFVQNPDCHMHSRSGLISTF